MNPKAEKLEKIVSELKQLPTVMDAVLLGRDGAIIAPDRGKETHLKRLSAMCAAMTGKDDMALSRFFDAGPESIVIKGKDCVLIVVDAGPKAVLMVLVEGFELTEDLTILSEMKSSRMKDLLS